MASYRSDGVRIPRLRDIAPQARNVSSPTITTQPNPSGLNAPLTSRPQIPKLMTPSMKTRRAASMSEAEGIRPILARSEPPSSRDMCSFIPTQIPTRPFRHQSPLSATSDQNLLQTFHTPTLPHTSPRADDQSLAQGRPRNTLRRKAPTIGQHAFSNSSHPETGRPSGLNVIIPNSARPSLPQTASYSSSQTDLSKSITSQIASQDRQMNMVEQRIQNGPKELASLRTTVNTQNLPPPTPVYPSASTPSTRYSGSPGVWSRTSTPASLSSCSPGVVQPLKVGSRLRQPSPSFTRLPVFSPQMQKSTSQGGQLVGRSPKLIQGTESTTSLLSDDPEDLAGRADLSRSSPISLLPRKTSTKSSIPRQIRVDPDATQNALSVNNGEVTESKAPNILNISSSQAPSRPSREGTDELQLEPLPVVRTNISPRAVKGHKRRASAESSIAIASNGSAAASVDSLHSRTSSRTYTRTPTSPELSRKSPRTLTKEPPKTPKDFSPEKTRRFGLFPKKSKPELDSRPVESRSTRKGPAAGTGHEGYGKYGQRGRRSSISSNSDRARSTSTTRSTPKSVASSKGSARGRPEMELDDFLLERLEPVFINGGGMDGGMLSRTQSEQSASGLSTMSAPGLAQKAAQSQATESLTSPSSAKIGDFRELHQRGLSAMVASSRESPSTSQPKIPSDNGPPTHTQRINISSSSQTLPQNKVSGGSTHHMEAHAQTKKSSKKGLNLKWSFFQKGPSSTIPEAPSIGAPLLPAKVARVGIHRPVAHYALVDTDSDPLEDIIHNIKDSPPTEEEEEAESTELPVEIPAGLNIRKPSHSILLPSPPKLYGDFHTGRPSSPKVYFQKNSTITQDTTTENERPSRLASVGRIPRVVSRRDRQHKPALQSFSRPFSVAEAPSLVALVNDSPQEISPRQQAARNPLYDGFHRNMTQFGFDPRAPFGDPLKQSALDFIAGPYSKNEFMAFSPRKDSMFSTTSSGSDSLAAITAVIPDPEAELNEDEIWGEYDDFIDRVISPETLVLPIPSRSASGEKFELATMASRALQAGLNSNTRQPIAPLHLEQPTVAVIPASPRSSGSSLRLRRSRIATALHTSLSPASQTSFSDMMAHHYEDQNRQSVDKNRREDTLTPTPSEVKPHSRYLNSPTLNPSPSFESCRHRNTILFDIAERDREGPTAQTNIRSGSLMTSRWLSFGRVLFSPAHKHIENGEQERILVVDGLGNDDWSFYCALTYPKAEVYCLNEWPTPTKSKHPAAWKPPPNYHTIHHESLEDPVPFPKGFFTVTVLRFPAACSEKAQDNIVSECKRVLRAGGYMEMSILDLDMVNMGNRTRKAVRKLKETMYLSDASISLKPASDNIQKLLGRHGFDNLRRCMVRIPVAGMIVRSSASSSSTSSSNPSTMTAAVTSSTALSAASGSSTRLPSQTHEKSSSNDTVLSLGDLLSSSDPSPSNDESIRKIVARVGRWWFTRCYESPILPNGDVDLSIWNDKKIIRECQQRGTGFRLLIAYAQKPSEKRRTASV